MILNILKALFLDDLMEFLDFWFYHFPKNTLRDYFDKIYSFDQVLKIKTNLRNLAKPLYGDYSLIGYLIAFPYRILRILFGLSFYLFIFLFYLIFIFLWLFLPPFLLIYGILLSK